MSKSSIAQDLATATGITTAQATTILNMFHYDQMDAHRDAVSTIVNSPTVNLPKALNLKSGDVSTISSETASASVTLSRLRLALAVSVSGITVAA
jgi:hypothetical protein